MKDITPLSDYKIDKDNCVEGTTEGGEDIGPFPVIKMDNNYIETDYDIFRIDGVENPFS